MSWGNAWLRGLAIFLYVVIATVWLPDFVLALGPINEGSAFVRDVAVVVVWGAALFGGMVLLRLGQKRGVI